MKHISRSLEETAILAEKWVATLVPGPRARVVALGGNLGGGKTAFVQAAAYALGVTETVTSPTFVLEKVYKLAPSALFDHLIHIDAYRFDDAAELERLGWNEIIQNPKNLICVEWPERVTRLIPEDALRIDCTFIDETIHEYEIKS